MESTIMRVIACFWLILCMAHLDSASIAQAQGPPATSPKTGEHQPLRVFNLVEGRTRVLSLKPEGARVKKGEIVCELDDTRNKAALGAQELVVRAAEADRDCTRLAREAAEMAVTEYLEGTFPQEQERLDAEVSQRKMEHFKADAHGNWIKGMFVKGYASAQEELTERLALQKSTAALKEVQARREMLLRLTRPKMVKIKTSDVQKARARELNAQAALELASARREELKQQLAACHLVAPRDGVVRFASAIAVGAVVREGDLLFAVREQ
jgi:HlyD family secretion protein